MIGTINIQNREITLETGEIAKQANGAVLVRQMDTVVLVTAVGEDSPKEEVDFFPLTVEYRERTAAAGRIPSGFVKRESRPQEHEILTSRLIDRSIRPLFPEGFFGETQVMATVLSYDTNAPVEPLAILGASAALSVSDIPWNGPIAGVSLARKNGRCILLPTVEEKKNSAMEMVVSCSPNGLVMVEGMADQAEEKDIVESFRLVQEEVRPFFQLMEDWQKALAVTKKAFEKPSIPEEAKAVLESSREALLKAMVSGGTKKQRGKAVGEVKKSAVEALREKFPEHEARMPAAVEEFHYALFREYLHANRKRADGRNFEEVRPISGKTGWLPRPHGSALFTRGETQAAVTCTLGITEDEQIVDSLAGETRQQFLLHYNFPPYCVGEARQMRGPGRREIGHGNLAYRALTPILPTHLQFPYTIRVVSDITESNGSSSMATVCGGCLSMMDAGVPIKKPVAGVAMGLLHERGEYIVLSDIVGDEDHMGDMDFKVAGTDSGVTAVQLDNKLGSLPLEVMEKALGQALQARLHILNEMRKIQESPRSELSRFAPRVMAMEIRKDRIRDLIGPGGKNIQEIQESNQVRIDVKQDGCVRIYSSNLENCRKALREIDYLTKELEVGKVYRGVVSCIKNFGAFVRIFANTEGLVHISEMAQERVARVEDVLKEGDVVKVRALGVDRQGKIRLSRKEALNVPDSEIQG